MPERPARGSKPRPRRGEAKQRYRFLAERGERLRWIAWPIEAVAFVLDMGRLALWTLGTLARILDPR